MDIPVEGKLIYVHSINVQDLGNNMRYQLAIMHKALISTRGQRYDQATIAT